jgi:hypothetical protein
MNPTHLGIQDMGPDVELHADCTDPWSTFDVHHPFWNSTSDESWLSAAIQSEHAISGITESFLNVEEFLHMEEFLTYSYCTLCQQVNCCCTTFDTFAPAPTDLRGDITAEYLTEPSTPDPCTPFHDEPPMGSAQDSSIFLLHTPEFTQSPRNTNGPTSSVSSVKKVSRRTKISKAAKNTLEQFFSSNPYPDKAELRTLRLATKLKENAIRTWFSNSRSRESCRSSSRHGIFHVRADHIQQRNSLWLLADIKAGYLQRVWKHWIGHRQ